MLRYCNCVETLLAFGMLSRQELNRIKPTDDSRQSHGRVQFWTFDHWALPLRRQNVVFLFTLLYVNARAVL